MNGKKSNSNPLLDDYDVKFYGLDVDVDNRSDEIHGSTTILLGPRVDILLKYETDSEYPLDEQNSVIPGLTIGAGLEYGLANLGVFA